MMIGIKQSMKTGVTVEMTTIVLATLIMVVCPCIKRKKNKWSVLEKGVGFGKSEIH
jgi:hypothetical protein